MEQEHPHAALAHPHALSPRTERADAAANRERILTVAEQLFAERGVAAVNMEEIAAAAQVGKGTLYRRFANKGELCLALLRCQIEQVQQVAEAQLQELALRNRPFAERIEWLLHTVLRFNDTHLALLCEVTRNGEAEEQIAQPLAWQHATLSQLLAEAQQQDALSSQFAPLLLADLLLASLRPPILRIYREVRGYSLAQLEGELRLLIHQLAAA
jgi:AcrR family transcriptional regulator